MKSNKKVQVLFLILGISFAISSAININFNAENLDNNEVLNENNKEINLRNPKKSGYWDENDVPFIHIANNWSDTESQKDWCNLVNGIYVIENVSINAEDSNIGILIENSEDDYFIIRNCTVYNFGDKEDDAAIRMYNVKHGKLIENNCSNNEKGQVNGFWLESCSNITLSENIAEYNGGNGIYIKNSNNITLLRNNASYNEVDGINLEDSHDNEILGNDVVNIPHSGEGNMGVKLRRCNNNNISGNNIYGSPEEGLHMDGDNNTVSWNSISYNPGGGIGSYGDNNSFLGNILNSNGINGIWIEGDYNNITGNNANYNLYGINVGDSNHAIVSGNNATGNWYYGILIGGGHYCTVLNNNITNNFHWGVRIGDNHHTTVINNNVSNNRLYGIDLFNTHHNTISNNTFRDNEECGIRLENCNYSHISGNDLLNQWEGIKGIEVYKSNHNNITQNEIIAFQIGIELIMSNNNNVTWNKIQSSIGIWIQLSNYNNVSWNDLYLNYICIYDDGYYGDNIVKNNTCMYHLYTFFIEIIEAIYTNSSFYFTCVIKDCYGYKVNLATLDGTWDGVPIGPVDHNLDYLYNFTVPAKFVGPGDNPIWLNLTAEKQLIYWHYYGDLNIQIAVQPETLKELSYLSIDILNLTFTEDIFNITFYIYNASNYYNGIDVDDIDIWWNGINVTSNLTKLGGGLYHLSLNPITVAPNENPILLNMTIIATGYVSKDLDMYIAVDPEIIDKDISPAPSDGDGGKKKPAVKKKEDILITIGIISATSGAAAVISIIAIKKSLTKTPSKKKVAKAVKKPLKEKKVEAVKKPLEEEKIREEEATK